MAKDAILIFVTRYLCYASNQIFAIHMADEFQKLGYPVEVCNIMDEEDAGKYLTKYIGKKYLAVIDFNSTLPRAMVGDQRFLDLLDAPFYNYIVDHPLYHHPILKLPLKNFNAIVIDPSYEAYIREYYPHIKRVITLPLAGTRAVSHPSFARKKHALLFTGTYYDPQKYRQLIHENTKLPEKELLRMAEILIDEPEHNPEEAFYEMRGMEHGSAEELNASFLAEIYARAVNREKVITEFVNSGIPMVICGNEWEKYPLLSAGNIKHLKGVGYGESMQLLAGCQACLNVLPGFRHTAHDRVFSTMLNHSVLVSDENEYLTEQFIASKDCELFNLKNLKEEALQFREKFEDTAGLEAMAEAGYEKCAQNHTWAERVKSLARELSK